MWTGMTRLPRNINIACNNSGLTHYGGILFFQEFLRMLQFRRSLAHRVEDFRSHHDYSLSQMTMAGKRSYDTLLCLEANSSFLWDTELRYGNAGTWAGSTGVLASCFLSIPSDIRELRVRADAGFGYNPVLETLEQGHAQYAVVARMSS